MEREAGFLKAVFHQIRVRPRLASAVVAGVLTYLVHPRRSRLQAEARRTTSTFPTPRSLIGTTSQTADVSIVSRGMRRLALQHGVVAFVFNATLLALTVDIASGLFDDPGHS